MDELESNVSLPELELILTAARDKEHRQQRFQAALKGVNLDDTKSDGGKTKFEEIQEKAIAELKGKDVEQMSLEELGFAVISE